MSEVFESEEVTASQDAVTQDISELAQVELQRDEYLDALQRLQADFENYRKRVARSSDDAAQRAAGALVSSLLPVLDALDLAAAHFASSSGDEVAALHQSRSLLLDSLVKQGLERVADAEVVFDPQIHDAVAHVVGDDDGDTTQVVDEVLRAGYRWKGNVLRPAMVRVKG